jgi:thioredoxin-related protein
MYRSNNSIFIATELPKNKPIIIIYFDPDCDHCQKLMNDVFKKINSFKKAEIVMVTFKPVEEVAAFEKKYKTHNYSNINVGTEGTSYQLRNYYKLINMPFTALYDKDQKFTYSYGQDISVDDLIKRLQNLK